MTRSRTQPQRVVDSLQTRILDGLFRPGDKLPPEPDLMREFGVSRTVVREAISSLQASGMVKTRHGVGTFVQERPAVSLLPVQPVLHAKQRLAMLELRISLESEAAYLAAQRRSQAHVEVMRQSLDDYHYHWKSGQRTAEDDYRFHMEVANATDNQYFVEVLATLGKATMQHHEDGAASAAGGGHFGDPLPILSDSKQIAMREHEAIYEAIARQDAASAKAAMLMHLSNSRERLRRKLSLVT
ncbi:FadR/GntR family transcriptional regulator [Curvibacter sp. CHRR-16]|uniref:FadR/GntR family transcriptional regulator n=1 Tax=Curvibacter sp. CHRR-16 TaxID=2835872 RepID=UPI002023A934|nr:FadR/GntR family transcriptional regulator [Curvibacter sp. CHRR-16]